MGWGTETNTAMISPSPPPHGPAQGTGSPDLDPGFQAAGTAGFLAGALNRPGNRGASTGSIAEDSFFRLTLNHGDATRHQPIIVGLSHRSAQSHLQASCYATKIRPPGRGAGVIRRHESRS
jgi:hypothetical protein